MTEKLSGNCAPPGVLLSGADLIAPASVHFEIGNAISAMLKRRRITSHQAAELLSQYQRIP